MPDTLVVIREPTFVVRFVSQTTVVRVVAGGPRGLIGPAGPQGIPGQTVREVPVGDIDGENLTFLTSQAFVTGSTLVFLNGLAQLAPDEYAEGDGQIVFVEAPLPGDTIQVSYSPEEEA